MNQALTPTHFRKLPAEAGEEMRWGVGGHFVGIGICPPLTRDGLVIKT